MSRFSQIPPIQTPISDGGLISQYWYRWLFAINSLFNSGFSGTIVTAQLTSGGTQGSITLVNGVVTAQVAAT